jgi:hypothetical protein
MAVLFSAVGSNPSIPAAGSDRAIVNDWIELDLDLDATGQILLYQFPEVAFLPNRAGAVRFYLTDAPGGSFAAGIDLTDSDGVADVELFANAAIAQDAMKSSAAAASEDVYIDVGGKYITLDISVVGTNTACTASLAVEYTQNVVKKAAVAS